MNLTLRNFSLVASLSAAGVLAACGGGGGGQASGTLSVAMTDAPACGYDEVNVTVNKIRVHQSAVAGEGEGGWTDITLNPSRRINLLDLTNGIVEELGQTSLPAGRYTQLRLVLDANTGSSMANSVVLSDTKNEVALTTPSGTQSGLKIGHTFDVEADQQVNLVLDFDACKSIVTTGNSTYVLKPVINVIPTAPNGIKGYIAAATNVSVSAQQDGVVVRSTVPNSTGEFFLARMAPGNYDVVITADGRATTVVAGVPVATATSTVALSTVGTPINLQTAASPARAISGTVTLPSGSSEVAYVAAQQTFAAGPKVTIKYQGTDLTTGKYTLSNLPTVAPQFGQYSATLPITFAAKSDTTPGTGKYAAAASANGVASKTVTPVDITTVDQTGIDFNLQ
jgi:hypothetical protein